MGTKYRYEIDLFAESKKFVAGTQAAIKSVRQLDEASTRTRNTIKQIAGAAGLTFGAVEIGRLIKDSIALAAKTEGVKAAFDKLNQPGLLNDLRKATRGTVDDLTLMTKAVEARNFKIPLDQLGTYFEFATGRAIETGQSVDYLVNSLIVGIGRKSVLWLDNLGLNITEINKELQQTPDFAEAVGKVISTEFKAAGDIADTASTKIQSFAATWANTKASFGKNILESEGFKEDLEEWGIFFDLLGDKTLGFGAKLKIFLKQDYKAYKDETEALMHAFDNWDMDNLLRAKETLSKRVDPAAIRDLELVNARIRELEGNAGGGDATPAVRTLKSINEELQQLKEILETADTSNTKWISSIYDSIRALEKEKKAVEELNIERAENPAMRGGKQAARIDEPLKVSEGFDPKKTGLVDMTSQINEATQAVAALDFTWKSFLDKMGESAEFFEYIQAGLSDLQVAGMDLTEQLMQFAGTGADSLEEFGRTVINITRDVIKAYLAEAVAGAVAKSVSSIPFPFNMALGALAAAGVTTMFNAIIPKFKDGAILTGPTIAEMGEYPGVKSNPEVIAPLNKLKGLLTPAMTEGSVVFKIGERELVGLLSRAERLKKNTR